MNAKVYAPQVPSYFDRATKSWIPQVDLEPARRFGELTIMFEPGIRSTVAVAPLVDAMKEQMAHFTAADSIISIGDPTLIAAAVGIAVMKTGGKLNLLKWDRYVNDYIRVELSI